MSQSKLNKGRSPTPTLCEVRTLVPKRTHAILAVAAKEANLSVSLLVNRIIAVACQELLREGATHEHQNLESGDDVNVYPAEYSKDPGADAMSVAQDDQGKSAQTRTDIL